MNIFKDELTHVVVVVMDSHVVIVAKLVDTVKLRVFTIDVLRVLFSGLAAQVALRGAGFICRITVSYLTLHFLYS